MSSNIAMTDQSRREIAEYEKIVIFAQQVASGTHPRVKIPPSTSSDFDLRIGVNTVPITNDYPNGKNILQLERVSESSKPLLEHYPQTSSTALSSKRNTTIPAVVSSRANGGNILHTQTNYRKQQLKSTSSVSDRELNIDFKYNYYKDLGVQLGVGESSIVAGFRSKELVWSPLTGHGKQRWLSPDPKVRTHVKDVWEKVQTAYLILSDPKLKREYEEGYCGPPLLRAPHSKEPFHFVNGEARDGKLANSYADNAGVGASRRRRLRTVVKLENVRPETAARLEKRGSAKLRVAKSSSASNLKPKIRQASPTGNTKQLKKQVKSNALPLRPIKVESLTLRALQRMDHELESQLNSSMLLLFISAPAFRSGVIRSLSFNKKYMQNEEEQCKFRQPSGRSLLVFD